MESQAGPHPSGDLRSRIRWIGLDGWVLQDGNYTDFVTGERRQFALEFGYARAKRLERSSAEGVPRCRHSGRGATYEVTGQLLCAAAEPMKGAFVLDVGLLAYQHWVVLDDLEPPQAGAWLTGEITSASTTSPTWTSSHTAPGCRHSSTPGRSTRSSSGRRR